MTAESSKQDDAAQPPAIVRRMFAHPRGLLGRVGAKAMLRRSDQGYRWVVDLLEPGQEDSFLDVGCGPGGLLGQVSATGAEVVGVDLSEDMVRLARAGGIEVHRASAHRLPLADDRFTLACAMHTIEFWPSWVPGLAELHRVLRPGGRLAIVVRAFDPQAHPWNPSRHGFDDNRLARLRQAITQAGFSHIERHHVTLATEQLVALTTT